MQMPDRTPHGGDRAPRVHRRHGRLGTLPRGRTHGAHGVLLVLLLVLATLAALASVGCTGGDQPATTRSHDATTSSTTRRATTSTTQRGTSTTAVSLVEVEGEVVFNAPYGDGPGAFGFIPADESVTDGPRAFWPLADGDLYILDPVNTRVQRAPPPGAGGGVLTIPISDALAPRDLAVAADASLVIDDSDGSATYRWYSPTGELRDTAPSAFDEVISVALTGDGTVIYAHMATGDSGRDTVYVPLYQDGELLRPQDGLDAAGPRVPLGGGWTAEVGSRSTEDEGGPPAGTLRVYDGEALVLETDLEPEPLGGLVMQRTAIGNLIVSAVAELRPGDGDYPSGTSATGNAVRVVWSFDRRGSLAGRLQLPLEQNLVDTFVTPARATPDGSLYTLSTDDQGLTIRRYDVE